MKSKFLETSSNGKSELFPGVNGFKSFKHDVCGLKVNFADLSGPLYSMSVVVPVKPIICALVLTA